MTGRQIKNDFSGPLQTLFQEFMADWAFSREKSAQEMIDTYFTPDFSAELDGHHLSRETFRSRIERMRQDAVVEEQEFVEMMEAGNKLFSMHSTRGRSVASGQPFETRVIAFFLFQGEKIKTCYLNSVTHGDPRDADFASRS